MKRRFVAALVTIIGTVSALVVALRFPPVRGLGTRVRLPVYHGAMTWATLIAFAALLIVSIWFLARRTDAAWRWESALRWTVLTLWLIGTVLGFIAAYNTWDLSAAQSSALRIMGEDPRLVIQVVILCLGCIVLTMPLVTESRRVRSIADIAFVVASFTLLGWAMNAGAALHPDSPIMNSPEILIKVLFSMMVVGHLVAIAGLASLLFVHKGREERSAT